MNQTRKKNTSNTKNTLTTLRNTNSKRYKALTNATNRKNTINIYKLNKNQDKLEKNLLNLSLNVTNTQVRLTKRIKKEGSKLAKKVLENPALMNAAKALFFKHLQFIPGNALNKANSMKNIANKTKNSIKNRTTI